MGVTYDEVWAVILVCGLALRALETRPDLGSDAHAVSLFDARADGLADLDSFANHLMADAEWPFVVTPAARDGVDIGTAHAAGLDLHVDIIVPKRL